MPVFSNNIFCITIDELEKCGISKNTIHKGIFNQRKRLVYCWPHHKEGKIVYLHYDGLKEPYKKLIKQHLLGGMNPEEWWSRNGKINELSTRFLNHLSPVTHLEKEIQDIKLPTGEYLPEIHRAELREACLWINFLITYDSKASIKKMGYTSMSQFWEDILFYLREKEIKLPYTYTKLRAKIREFKKRGIAVLLDNRLCHNNNAAKIKTPEQLGILTQLMGHYNRLDASQICKAYNEIAKLKNWSSISRRTIIEYVQKNTLYLTAAREGKKKFRDKISMQITRHRPSMPLAFWSLDGWKAELYYKKTYIDKEGHKITTYNNRLVIYIVLDTYCNYPVGYAIDETENNNLVKIALKNAIDHVKELYNESIRPWQIQSDRAGIKHLTPIYEGLAQYFTPAAVGNAKAKPVERYNKTLIENYCQYYPNFSGYGIKSEKQPNIDIKNLIKKDFPDKQGCIKQLHQIIAKERKIKYKEMMEAWKKVPEEKKLHLSRENYLLLLGNKKERSIRLQGKGITPTINGNTYKYDSFNPAFRTDLLTSWSIYYDEKDLSTILAVSPDQKRRFLLEQKYEQPMALVDRQPEDINKLMQVNQYNHNLEKRVSELLCDRIENGKKVLKEIQLQHLTDKTEAVLLTDNRGQHKIHTYFKEELELPLPSPDKKKTIKTKKELTQSEIAYFEYVYQNLDIEKYKNL